MLIPHNSNKTPTAPYGPVVPVAILGTPEDFEAPFLEAQRLCIIVLKL